MVGEVDGILEIFRVLIVVLQNVAAVVVEGVSLTVGIGLVQGNHDVLVIVGVSPDVTKTVAKHQVRDGVELVLADSVRTQVARNLRVEVGVVLPVLLNGGGQFAEL